MARMLKREKDAIRRTNILRSNIVDSIEKYISDNSTGTTVSVGQAFSEWTLYNLFDLREEDINDATEISGQGDNSIDAIFTVNDDLYIVQCKYRTSHMFKEIPEFKDTCIRLLTVQPTTNRDIVYRYCSEIRDAYENNKKIYFFYVTDNEFGQHENIRISEANKALEEWGSNLRFYFLDLDGITEWIQEKTGELPQKFNQKKFRLTIENNMEFNNTIIAIVKLKNLVSFINEGNKISKGNNLLFQSNIRTHLKNTPINNGILATLEEEPEQFWYYNNGITIVCDEYEPPSNNHIFMSSPQIVNGCQTANQISKFYGKKSNEQNSDGSILVKIIKTVKNSKMLRDNITRYTNSQNAVRGLDFYALNYFQKDLQVEMQKIGYYYEIQRGGFLNLPTSEQKRFKGSSDYSYLVSKKFDNYLLAKEVVQSFAAGMIQMPGVAYGEANELTPNGDHWDKIVNDETAKLSVEYFLFPMLVLIYSKSYLKYNRTNKKGSDNQLISPSIKKTIDFRRSAGFLFVSTYYLLLIRICTLLTNKQYDTPTGVPVEVYRKIFKNSDLNTELLKLTDKILTEFFRDDTIKDEVGDDLKNFLKRKIRKTEMQSVLFDKIQYSIEDADENLLEQLLETIKEESSTTSS